jgi:hypothetical protein
MPPPLAPDLRRWAMQCTEESHRPNCTPEKRQRLLKMRQAYLALESRDRRARPNHK